MSKFTPLLSCLQFEPREAEEEEEEEVGGDEGGKKKLQEEVEEEWGGMQVKRDSWTLAHTHTHHACTTANFLSISLCKEDRFR